MNNKNDNMKKTIKATAISLTRFCFKGQQEQQHPQQEQKQQNTKNKHKNIIISAITDQIGPKYKARFIN